VRAMPKRLAPALVHGSHLAHTYRSLDTLHVCSCIPCIHAYGHYIIYEAASPCIVASSLEPHISRL
jgi:hypothetical protein